MPASSIRRAPLKISLNFARIGAATPSGVEALSTTFAPGMSLRSIPG
jgi:hypothetical protein